MEFLLTTLALMQPVLIAALPEEPAAPITIISEDEISTCDAAGEERDPILGAPLCVNGVRIPDLEIKRYLIYDVGRLHHGTVRLQQIMDNEVAIMKVAEQDVSRYALSEEEIEKAVRKKLDEFEHNYPELQESAEIRRAYRSEKWFREQLAQTLLFDRTFMPPDPDTWPVLTLEAIRQETGGDFWIDDARRSYARRLNLQQVEGGDLKPEDETYMRFIRDIIIRALGSFHESLSADDGLNVDVALVVGDREFGTEELWAQVRDEVTARDVYKTKRWLAAVEAAKQRLAKLTFVDEEGNKQPVLLDRGEFSGIWRGFKDQVQASSFNLESTAVATQGFASVAAYRDFYLLRESMRRYLQADLKPSVASELTEGMRAHLSRANRSMGIGMIDCEMILCSAFDFNKFEWKENGWAGAKKHADQVKSMLDEHQSKYAEQRRAMLEAQAKGEDLPEMAPLDSPEIFWTKTQEDQSEFWDPPPPKHGKQAATGYKSKGRFGEKTRNDLSRMIGEDYFNDLLMGDSVTNYVFYEQIPGTIAGPFRGPHGYYITKVKRRKPPTRPLNLGNEKHFEMLAEDFLRERVVQFLAESIKQGDIKGLDDA